MLSSSALILRQSTWLLWVEKNYFSFLFYCVLSIHCTDIWLHSSASDVTQYNLWPFSLGRRLSSAVPTMWWRCFLWATESCCAINLLLFSCYFFVWDDEQWDFVATVVLSVLSAQHQCCIILYPAPGLLHKFFTPCIVWLNKYVIRLNRSL